MYEGGSDILNSPSMVYIHHLGIIAIKSRFLEMNEGVCSKM